MSQTLDIKTSYKLHGQPGIIKCPYCLKWTNDKMQIADRLDNVDGSSEVFDCDCGRSYMVEIERPIIYHITGIKD